jgi:CheY-like chemotaxis protein
MAKTFGLEVDTARDGAQALRMVEEADRQGRPYDLTLMDWKMPAMDGVETVRQLREGQLRKTPTVIMVTAFGREEALTSAGERGVSLPTVLTKPVTPSTLLEAIGEVLGKGNLISTRSEERAESHEEAMAQLKGARILLVEDNDMNQELAVELLHTAGVTTVVANHGQEALDTLAQDSAFDGVLMDCQMPVMDGYSATRAIRQNPAFKDLPIIAMTANAMAGDREKVLEAGMNDHIAKPLDVGAMFATLAKWIKPRYSHPEEPGGATQVIAAHAISTRSTGQIDHAALAQTAPFAALQGIDVAAGLATTLSNTALYTRLLHKFLSSQGDFGAIFARARADTDPTAAARAAHNLKATAGNIGAKGLQQAAAALELACEQTVPDARVIDDLLQRTLTALAPVVQGLRAFATGGRSPEAPSRGTAPNGASLDRLERQLLDSNVEAADTLEALRAQAEGTPLEAGLRAVADAVEAFDFDAAILALRACRVSST